MTTNAKIIWFVLEAAKDAGDDHMVSICRQLVVAHRLGQLRKHANKMSMVREFYEMLKEITDQPKRAFNF